MTVQLQPNKREAMYLAAGIVIGLALVGIYSGGHFYNVVYRQGVTLFSWPGPSSAKESIKDDDADGNPEGWTMTMNPRDTLELKTSLVDSNKDAKYDSCLVEIRPGGESADGYLLAIVDSDNNGYYDGVQVSNTGLKGTRYADYRDWNMDGFLDIYLDKSRGTSWIATGTEWLKVVKRVESEERRYIVLREGQEREMVFRDGDWSDVTPVAQ